MRLVLISFLIFLMAVLSSCESEDDNYSGVGKLIADRNKMRYQLADEKGTTGPSNQNTDSVSNDGFQKEASKEKLSTNVLDEKKIVIVETDSGKSLGQGIAYVNKKGEIVKIKLAH